MTVHPDNHLSPGVTNPDVQSCRNDLLWIIQQPDAGIPATEFVDNLSGAIF
jgi:hypothetical protein